MSHGTTEFSKLRKYLWPIHFNELPKVLPAVLMFFFIVYTYTTARIIKDSQVISFGGEGSLPIPYLKLFVFITSLSYTIFYAHVSNKYEKTRIFYGICIFFFIFYSLFCFVIMPNHFSLQFSYAYNVIMRYLPGAKGLAIVLRDWDTSLFYVASELFGSIMISAEFYILANNISRISEAKRFYAVFGLIANFANIVSGQSVRFITSSSKSASQGLSNTSEMFLTVWMIPLTKIIITMLVSITIIVASYFWIQKYVVSNPHLVDQEAFSKSKKKTTMSISQSIAFLSNSQYMKWLTVMIFSYGMVINIIEILWKNSWKIYFKAPADIATFQSSVTTAIGITTIIISLFISHNMLRIFSWSTVAYATPILIGVTAIPFFASIIFEKRFDDFILSLTGYSVAPGFIAVYGGAFQNIFAKASKYALFDPTKEMVYIGRDNETKSKGKVAADILGARTGKFSGSAEKIIEGFITKSSSVKGITTLFVFLGVASFWIFAVSRLGRLMNDETKSR